MRRADRLFQIVQYLRGGRLVTAAKLAERLEVSERTIYRDIADLQSTGVPIDGEAGIGYIMRSGFDLPPLMFTHDEIVALVAGARIVRSWGGVAMARAAEEALVKIEAVLPENDRDRVAATKIFAPYMGISDETRQAIDACEAAIEARSILSLAYRDEQGSATDRDVQPLGLWFWGKVWTLVAWCELRDDFRMFRLDRIAEMKAAGRSYTPVAERSLAECLRQIEAEYGPQR
ncbi:helix-turn-helix transcriptional regulator [Parasphingopyxis marina]|uniref:YafY family transcriptional regulator n=1 Tax=Parasphingopyxis marina TaxID=2761622 RepID=A0A842HZ23_9SPHN|nr:YafY family protein [Parasphingopyxis marina]MBC2778182.1 YafY family transcriptional regulator [Parasphingopyxis marina]